MAANGTTLVRATDPGSPYSFNDLDINSLLILSVFVFMQQIGFMSLEVGSIRAKNARSILMKNIVDKLLCGLCFWAVGFAFAYGDSKNGVIGASHFFLSNLTTNSAALWFYSWVFLLSATTIVSGAIAERAQFEAYLAYTPLMAGLVYPLVAHWVNLGWLTTFAADCAYIDYAGGSTVHLLGGLAGFMGAWLMGPRIGRFSASGPHKAIIGHNVSSIAIGTLLMWFGWYGFNAAPAYLRGNERTAVAARATVNTSLAGCGSALTVLALYWGATRRYDLHRTTNATLGGLVAITSICPHVEPWGAFVIGIVAGVVYLAGVAALVAMRVDDPLEACVVHGACALVGLLGVGVLAKPAYLAQQRGSMARVCGGIVYTHLGWQQLGVQLLGVIVIGAYVGSTSFLLFYCLKRSGRLRVDQQTEIAGIDNIDHGGPAYPDFVMSSHE